MKRIAPWLRGLAAAGCALSLLLIVGVSLASATANVLMMPDRQAIKGTAIVVWGNTKFANGRPFDLDFGDSTAHYTGNVGDRTYIATTHSYAAAGAYAAKLRVYNCSPAPCSPYEEETATITVVDPAIISTTDLRGVKINMAIEDGLRWLYVNQENRSALTPTSLTTFWAQRYNLAYNLSFTSLIVLAFENHGHSVTNDPNKDIYQEVVQRGLNYIFDNLNIVGLSVEPMGSPCVGVPIDANQCSGLGEAIHGPTGYATSIALLAVAGSGAPTRTVAAGLGTGASGFGGGNGGFVVGKTYQEIVQRMSNTVSWAQADSGFYRGGWRYGLDDNGSDGSAIGWAVLALMDAEAFGATIPAFVRTELDYVIVSTTVTTATEAGLRYDPYCCGDFGPSTPRTGILLQALKFMNIPLADPRVQKTLTYISNRWNAESSEFATCSWVTSHAALNASLLPGSPPGSPNNKGCGYGMFNVFKGLKLYGVATLAGVNRPATVLGLPRVGDVDDWYEDYRDYLVANQQNPTTTTGGNWGPGQMWWSCCDTDGRGITALAELILAPVALILPTNLTLEPLTSSGRVGSTHTVTATATSSGGTPVPGATVTFTALAGSPNAGTLGTATTDSNGKAKLSYSSALAGTDTLRASIGSLQSNTVTRDWVVSPPDIVVATGTVTKVGTTLQVELKLKNNGGSVANNLKITAVTPLAPVTYAGPALPVNKGNLAAGGIATELLSLNLNGVASGQTVRFTVRGTYQDSAGTNYSYTSTRLVKVP